MRLGMSGVRAAGGPPGTGKLRQVHGGQYHHWGAGAGMPRRAYCPGAGLDQVPRRAGAPIENKVDTVSEQSDYDGWMEAWISCALHVRQRGVKGKALSPDEYNSDGNDWIQGGDTHDDDYDDDDDYVDLSGQHRTRSRQHALPHCPSSRGEGPATLRTARPWTACPQSYRTQSSWGGNGSDRHQAVPARPHSATGAGSSGGTSPAGAGNAWRRELSERAAPRRPMSSQAREARAKGSPRRRGVVQGTGRGDGRGNPRRRGGQTPSRRGRRRVGRDGQVRVLAAWSYQASARHGRGDGSLSPTRQILVKVPCVKTNDGRGGDHSTRGGGAPYRLAWNDEVKRIPDGGAACNAAVDNNNGNNAVSGVDGDDEPTGLNDGDRGNDRAIDPAAAAAAAATTKTTTGPAAPANGDDVDPRLSSPPAVAERFAPPRSFAGNQATGLTVQLPRPVEGDEASSTMPDGNGDCYYNGRDSGYSSHFSGSDSRGWQSLLEDNKCSTSRVIANLRASVACETRPSSARIHSSSSYAASTTAAGAAAAAAAAATTGPGLFPVSVLEVRQGDAALPGRVAYSSTRVGPCDNHDRGRMNARPKSAAGSTTAGRFSRSMESGGGGGGRGGGRQRGVTATSRRVRTHLNGFADDVADGAPVSAATTKRRPAGQRGVGTANAPPVNVQRNGSQRTKSAGAINTTNRRRRDVRAQEEYSFFPSAPAENASSGCDGLFDGFSGNTELLLAEATSRGDVGEWEGSLCSNVDERSRLGYALDSPGTWREAVGF